MTEHSVTPTEPTDLTEPTVPGLIYLLRHKEMWPEGFVWKYNRPCSCAMGLSLRFWQGGRKRSGALFTRDIAPLFDLPKTGVFYIIFEVFPRYKGSELVGDDFSQAYFRAFDDVTPEDIADALEIEYAKLKEAR